jgi:hypothetical protein
MRKMMKWLGSAFAASVLLFALYVLVPTRYSRAGEKALSEGGDLSGAFNLQQGGGAAGEVEMDITAIDVPYICNADSVEIRQIWFYTPASAEGPLPTIYIPHYEMKATSAELKTYIAAGWAVAAPKDETPANNGALTGDDLVFNNAALYTLRHMPEQVDKQRIALVGGSAGGYMTLMLDALQMGITASVANSPIVNIHYNLFQYFPLTERLNAFWQPRVKTKALCAMLFAKDKVRAVIRSYFDLPVPFVGLVSGQFEPNARAFPDQADYGRFEAFSPVALTGDFSSPFMLVHYTSDMLVPIDQIDSRFVQPAGNTVPKQHSTELDKRIPGPLGRTFVEELPADRTHVLSTESDGAEAEIVLDYDPEKMFNVHIVDDGPKESCSSHHSALQSAPLNHIGYVESMLAKTLAGTEILVPGKLLLILDRYMGHSIQLPPHTGVDDSVYGSLAVYQEEAVEAYSDWAWNHSMEELDVAMEAAIASLADPHDRMEHELAWKKIKGEICEE